MARSYRPVVRDQEFLLPPNMAEWLPAGHLVWFVIDVVDQLDTTAFHARRRRGRQGRQGYDPDMLLALLLYSYAVGERSSRRIERLCVDHVAFRVLCGQDPPDHSTLARFRADHADDFTDLFAQVLRLCVAAGMGKVGVIAIDGTKIAAAAARGANRTAGSVREEARRIAKEVVDQAAGTDAAEDAAVRSASEDRDGGDGLPPGFAEHGHRAAVIAKALAELDRQDSVRAAEEAVEEATAAERVEEFLSRVEAGQPVPGVPPAGVDPVRFHQARVDRYRRELAALEGIKGPRAAHRRGHVRHKVAQATESLHQAHQRAHQRAGRGPVAAGRGRGQLVNLSDPESRLMMTAAGGSIQGYNAQLAVTDDHLILGVHLSQDANDFHCFAPTLTQAVLGATVIDSPIELVLADAGYFTNENLLIPGPDRLIAPGKKHRVAADAHQHPASGPPPQDASPADAMRHRLRTPQGAEIYKRRSATVETMIAHLKDHVGLRTFSRRGFTAALAELNLAATVINIRRIHAAGHPAI